ncbi:transmembrane channel-like protein 7 [Alosa sapidissima]|uniref:transmembrane channel-like protein 7 n=1 Tax=Alosa sapidissima TaxID=34773 RepID=UPI001C09D9E2|nr:transmembrane channel-like protein 7 [Alosa sapidissima]
MELNEFNRNGVATAGSGYFNSEQSLRLRRPPSHASNQNASPHFDWGRSSEGGEDEDEEEEEPRHVRELPMPFALRKAVRQVQQMRVPVASRRARRSRALKRFSSQAKNALALVTLWRKSIHKIGGHFGGGVQSYFVFLRFLVVLNFLSSLLIAGFVLIPAIVFNSLHLNTTIPEANLTGFEVCMVYDTSPNALTVFYTYFLDLLSGTGFMEYSYMFYGYYNNTMIVTSGFSYNIPLAYLLTASFYFIFCFICIIVRMGGVWRVAVTTGGGTVGGYSMLLFTGWDYGLQGDRATKLKQNNIRYQLQVDLEEERLQLKAKSLTLLQTVGTYALRTLLNLIVLALIGGAFTGIAFATQFSQTQKAQEGIVGLLLEYLPSIVITASNFVVPLLCDQIALLEKHSPSTTIILALLRAVFLRLVSLAVLLFTLWENITCYTDRSACSPCQYNHRIYQCWETRVGQEMYKLVLFDFLTTIVKLILVDFPRRMVVDNCSWSLVQWLGREEFLLPPNVLGLVYAQTVVWTGALFCPLLPLLNTIKFVFIFYCKKISLFQNCRPAARTFRSTSSNVVFFLVLLFGWSLATTVLIYSMAELHPSYGCGPFRFSVTMWSIVPNSFQGLSPTTKEFLRYIGSQAFSIPLLLLSCVVLCYVAALASVYGNSVALLKAQLKLEGRDKQFLVKQIEELTKKQGVPKHDRDPILRDPTPMAVDPMRASFRPTQNNYS